MPSVTGYPNPRSPHTPEGRHSSVGEVTTGTMTNVNTASLQAGESTARDNGERYGRSAGGRMVLLRRRRAEPGFVVTVDAPGTQDEPTEMITSEWGAANAAFGRMMKAF